MNIGLYDVDSKMPNLALMKLSAWHKAQGNTVEFYKPLWHKTYAKVYASKVFTYTDDSMIFDDMEVGGSGINMSVQLLEDIEHIMPDYNLYPMDYSLGFTSRGCFRKCDFCLVSKKEGKLKYNTDIYEFWGGHKNLVLLDNNIFGLKGHFGKIAEQILKENLKVDFNQGLDIRLLTDEKAKILKELKPIKFWRFAFDDIKDKDVFCCGAETLKNNNISPEKIFVYVLVGFNNTFSEDMEKVKMIDDYGFQPFAMIYKDFGNHRPSQEVKSFARYVNHKAIFKSISFAAYKNDWQKAKIDFDKARLI